MRYYYNRDFAAPDFTAYEFKAYRQEAVAIALARLFRDKCAYCEIGIGAGDNVEIEHFRPKGGVADAVHPGYWWLAHTWTNLLPSCSRCNQRRRAIILDQAVSEEEFERLLYKSPDSSHGKQNHFPVAGVRAMHRKDDLTAEDPLLIDPTVVDPAEHLTWEHDGPQVLVRPRVVGGVPDPKGVASIKAYALNRVKLIARRNAKLKVLRGQRTQILDRLKQTAVDDEAWEAARDRALGELPYMLLHCDEDQEFTAMARAFINDFERELRAMGTAVVA